jgi:phage terminase large subunit GpA-like protein
MKSGTLSRNYQIQLSPAPDHRFDKLRAGVSEALSPPPLLTVAQWADQNRKLPRISSSEYGPWRTSRFPFLREIMADLSLTSSVQEVAVMKGSQLGFTEVALNLMFYNIDHHPVPMLYVQPTIDTIEKFSKQRFTPSAELVPKVYEKIGDMKSRDSSNTLRLKSFPGGIIIMGGANSAASLRSMPIEVLMLDEWDGYPTDVDSEGDPAELAIRRTANFPRRKIFYLSTPGVKEVSRIEPKFLEGDQRYYNIPCPHCGKLQVLKWENLKWRKRKDHNDEPEAVWYRCEHCKKNIDERDKTQFLSEENGACWIAENPGAEVHSYHLSALYSPLGFFGWRDAVKMFLRATHSNNKELLKVFVNTVLGESWTEEARTVAAVGLLRRIEKYPADVPAKVMVLTAGADVQEDRIECEVVGWARDLESWSISYQVFRGDTEGKFVWQQLDDFLRQTWRHESGQEINIAIAAVDSGHRARVVYRYCKLREHRNIFPIKGAPGWGKGYIRRPLKNKRNDDGVYLFGVFVDEVKSRVYSSLRIDEPSPGYCHFPDKVPYDRDYFRMLTAERLVTRRVRGFVKLQWELLSGRRNEALDCRVYAIAALNILNPNFDAIEQRGGVMSFTESKMKRAKKRRSLSSGVT